MEQKKYRVLLSQKQYISSCLRIWSAAFGDSPGCDSLLMDHV
jgi:hypothetical protein